MSVTHDKPCVKMNLRHMASHVSTCKGFELCINRGGSQPVYSRREQKERRKEREKRKKRKEKEKKGRKRKEASGFVLSTLAFQRSELVEPRSKVRRFGEGLRFKK